MRPAMAEGTLAADAAALYDEDFFEWTQQQAENCG
jgi:hypothetical protein